MAMNNVSVQRSGGGCVGDPEWLWQWLLVAALVADRGASGTDKTAARKQNWWWQNKKTSGGNCETKNLLEANWWISDVNSEYFHNCCGDH